MRATAEGACPPDGAVLVSYGMAECVGRDRWAPLLGDACAVLPFPHEVIRRGEPLRFNTSRYAGRRPAAGEGPRARVAAYLHGMVPEWDRAGRRFLDAYFSFIDRQFMEWGDEIDRLAAPHGGLFRREDWWFSALKPLPRACLFAASEDREGGPKPLDFVFADGAEILVFRKYDAIGSRRTSFAAIGGHGVRVVDFEPSSLDEHGDFLRRALPATGQRFWEGETLPCGPFDPTLGHSPNHLEAELR